MPTIVDSLIVTLGLEASDFTKGQKQSAEALLKTKEASGVASKEMEANAKKIASGIVKVRNELLTLLAVFTAGVGLKDFTTNTIKTAENAGFLAANLGMTTEKLTAYQRASEMMGGTQAGMTAQLKESAAAAAKWKAGLAGDDSTIQWFIRNGGDVNALKNGNEYLLARADILAKLYTVDPQRAALAAQQMGISEDMFNMLRQGRSGVLALVEAQEKNSHLTEAQAAAALKLDQQWKNLKFRLEDVSTQVLLSLTPSFEKLVRMLDRMASWFQAHQGDINRWVDNAVSKLGEFAAMIDGGAQSVGGWKVVLEALLALKIASWAVQLLTLGGALASVGSGLGLIASGASALPILTALGLIAVPAAAATALAKGLNKIGPLHRRGDIDPDTGKMWEPVGSHGQGKWVDAPVGTIKKEWKKGANRAAGHWAYSRVEPTASASPQAPTKADALRYDAPELDAYAAEVEKRLKLPDGLLTRIKSAGERTPIDAKTGTYAVSRAGAAGLMQFMPAQWAHYGDGKDINDPRASIDAAGKLLADLLKQYQGNEAAAVAAYNGGTRQGRRVAQGSIPSAAETRDYLRRVERGRGGDQAIASTTTSEVNIGEINIATQATDAPGIARSIGPAIRRYDFATQANTGLN